jgi:hypothetical protein
MKAIIPILLVLLVSSASAITDQEELDLERYLYRDITDVKQFYSAYVILSGTA